MTLEEQFQKETGAKIEDLDEWKEFCEYYAEYSEWLEGKLTWKKFSEQKPDIGSKIMARSRKTDLRFYVDVSATVIDIYTNDFKDGEWMHAPE